MGLQEDLIASADVVAAAVAATPDTTPQVEPLGEGTHQMGRFDEEPAAQVEDVESEVVAETIGDDAEESEAPDLDNLLKDELEDIAEELGIVGRASMNKAELKDAIREAS